MIKTTLATKTQQHYISEGRTLLYINFGSSGSIEENIDEDFEYLPQKYYRSSIGYIVDEWINEWIEIPDSITKIENSIYIFKINGNSHFTKVSF